jgi:GNAT superfamily N-acetyltransferase
MSTRSSALITREVAGETWPDFEKLFEAKGGPSYCWCMAGRASPTELKTAKGPHRKRQIAERVDSSTAIGILGDLNLEPVAWCSIAPRSTYRRLVSNGTPDEGVWSILCFYVSRSYRRTCLAAAMLAAAITHAKRLGAKVVERYPVDTDSPSYRHMGYVSMFEARGFLDCGREGSRRHVMQLPVKR